MFLQFAVLSNSILLVLSVCELDSRYRSNDLALDESFYEWTTFDKALISGCGCDSNYTCVRKCCDENYELDNGNCIFQGNITPKVSIYRYGNIIINDEDHVNYRFVSGITNCTEDDSFIAVEEEFFIQQDGRIWLPFLRAYFEQEHYCIDYMEFLGFVSIVCIIQYDTQRFDVSNRITVVGMWISLPFLVVTFLVYAILPLRNLHGKALMCYIFSLFVYYTMTITTDQDTDEHSALMCRIFTMTYYYFFEASFIWMNVMCIDICLTFSTPKVLQSMKKRIERNRFIFYNIYAWSVPLILVIIVQTFSLIFKPNKWYNPGVTDEDCWLNDGIPTFVFLYLPMTIVIITNIILFSITAYKIRRAHKDTAVLRKLDTSKSSEDTIIFAVYLKLFLAMGITWVMEVIAWAIKWRFEKVPHGWWYFTDFCNAAFGFIIFLIFVCNKKVWRLTKLKYYKITGRQAPESSTSDRVTMQETTAR